MARACGLVFLINKLASSNNEIGIRATVDTLADLLVEDLTQGSSALRSKLPSLLDKCELLMKVGDEYRIQTEESAAWNDEFLSQRNSLANEAHRVDAERDDRIRRRFGEMVRKLSLTQGSSKVTRDIFPVFDAQLPGDANREGLRLGPRWLEYRRKLGARRRTPGGQPVAHGVRVHPQALGR